MPDILIITGMHCSATSLIAGLFHQAGLDLGERLLERGEGSPNSFFEDEDFYAFHEQALHRRGRTYLHSIGFIFSPTPEEERSAGDLISARQEKPLWGWKDPRTSLFVGFWGKALPEARFVLLYRHPYDVLCSLVRRGELLPDLMAGVETWSDYNARLLDFYQANGARCLLCHCYSVVDEPERFSRLLANKLGLELRIDAQARDRVYRPEHLRREAVAAIDPLFGRICGEALALYRQLDALADMPSQPEAASASPPAALAFARECFSHLSEKKEYDRFTTSGLLQLLTAASRQDAARSSALARQHLADLQIGHAWLAEQRLALQTELERRDRALAERQAWIESLEAGKAWLENQSENWQRIAEERGRLIEAQRAYAAELESGKKWLEEQEANWRSLAEEQDRRLGEQQGLIRELEQANRWLTEQRGNWQREAELRQEEVERQRAWIEELEAAKGWLEKQRDSWQREAESLQAQVAEFELARNWLEGQYQNWQREAEARADAIRRQKDWIGELEQAKAWLEEQHQNWQREAEARADALRQQQTWIQELDKANRWHSEQLRAWQELAESREGQIAKYEEARLVRLLRRLRLLRSVEV